MKERGRYQLQCMKSRSSTGVGHKVDLTYNIETMRITDEGEETAGDGHGASRNINNVLNNIKSISTVNRETSEINSPKINATVDSSKLKSMLAGLKTSE
jgi:polyribonucleotide nucleotidyltransferase